VTLSSDDPQIQQTKTERGTITLLFVQAWATNQACWSSQVKCSKKI